MLCALLLITAASATSYYSLVPGSSLFPGDQLLSPDGRSSLSIGDSKKTVRLFGPRVGRFLWKDLCGSRAISQIELSSFGNLKVYCGNSFTRIVMANGNTDAFYVMSLQDNTNLIVSLNDKLVWESGVNGVIAPDQGFKYTWTTEKVNNADNSYPIGLYALDSQVQGMRNAESENELRHADYIASIMHAKDRTTNNIVDTLGTNDKTFSEPQFIKGVYDFYRKAISTKDQPVSFQIINFSGAFRQENSDVADCAIQWIYKKGLYFVAAAGNDGKLRTKYNPYQILVGGVEFANGASLGTHWESGSKSTAYGPAITIWGPAELAFRPVQGTSIAAAKVSRHLISLLFFNEELKSNSALGYQVLYNKLTLKNVLVKSDPKINSSSNANNLLIGDGRPQPTFDYSDVKPVNYNVDFCGRIGLPKENPKEKDWSALMSKADPTVLGDFVAALSTSLCACTRMPCRC